MTTATVYRNMRQKLPQLPSRGGGLYHFLQKTRPDRSSAVSHSTHHTADIYDFLKTVNLLDNITYDDPLVCGVTVNDMNLVFPKGYIRDVLSIGVQDLQMIKHMKKMTTTPKWGAEITETAAAGRYFNWSDSYPLSQWLNLKVSSTLPDDMTSIIELDVVIQSLREEYQSQHP